MKYTYDRYDSKNNRVDTTTNLNEIEGLELLKGGYVQVFDNSICNTDGRPKLIKRLNTVTDLNRWKELTSQNPFIEKEMEYTYHLKDDSDKVVHSTKDWTKINENDVTHGNYVVITKENNALEKMLKSVDDLEDWAMIQERKVWTSVDPKHYKGYIGELQWIDAMCALPTMKDPKVFSGALELMVRKYLDRRGQKDSDVQELKKARFYLEYMIQYLEGQQPKAEAVHKKLQ